MNIFLCNIYSFNCSYDKCKCSNNTLLIIPTTAVVGNTGAKSRATGVRKHFRSASCDVKMIRSLLLKDTNCNTLECCEETSKFRNFKNNSANINAAAIINLSRHNSSDLNAEFRHKYIAHSNSMSIPKDDQTHINQLGGIRYIQNYLKPYTFLNENNTNNANYNHCGDTNDSNTAAITVAVADNYCTNVIINNDDNDNALLNNIDNHYNIVKNSKNGNIINNDSSRVDKDELTTGCGHFVRKHRRNHSYDQIFLPNNKRSDMITDNMINNCGNNNNNPQHQHIYHYCNYNLPPQQHCHYYLQNNYGRKKNINLLKNTMSFEQSSGKVKSSNENSVVTKLSETNSDLNSSHSRNNSKDLNNKVSHEMFINLKTVASSSAATEITPIVASSSAIVAANPTINGLNCEITQSVLRHRRTNSKEMNSFSSCSQFCLPSVQAMATGNTSTGQLPNTGPISPNTLITNNTLCDLSLNSKSVPLQEDKLIESQINDYEKHLN